MQAAVLTGSQQMRCELTRKQNSLYRPFRQAITPDKPQKTFLPWSNRAAQVGHRLRIACCKTYCTCRLFFFRNLCVLGETATKACVSGVQTLTSTALYHQS